MGLLGVVVESEVELWFGKDTLGSNGSRLASLRLRLLEKVGDGNSFGSDNCTIVSVVLGVRQVLAWCSGQLEN